jgi:hypothetical protein
MLQSSVNPDLQTSSQRLTYSFFVWDLLQPLSEQLSHIQKATDKLRPCAISLNLGRERAVQSLWVAEEKSFRERSKSARVQECKKLNGIEWVFVV